MSTTFCQLQLFYLGGSEQKELNDLVMNQVINNVMAVGYRGEKLISQLRSERLGHYTSGTFVWFCNKPTCNICNITSYLFLL